MKLYHLLIRAFLRNIKSMNGDITEKMISVERIPKFTATSDNTSTIPNTKVMLVMQESMISPIASSRCLFLTAIMSTVSSGSEVPSAIIVAPITDCFMPVASAIDDALSTIIFALEITTVIPMKKNISDLIADPSSFFRAFLLDLILGCNTKRSQTKPKELLRQPCHLLQKAREITGLRMLPKGVVA